MKSPRPTRSLRTLFAACFFPVLLLGQQAIEVGNGPVVRPILVEAVGAWTVEDTVPWLSTSVSQGYGTRNVEIITERNTTGADRTDSIIIAGETYTVTQRAAGSGLQELWGMGSDTGLGIDRYLPSSPIPVLNEELSAPLSDVQAVAGGVNHSLILRSNGTLWATGQNWNGQLGDGTTTSRTSPVQVADDVTLIAAGGAHSLFVKSDGTLWAMGSNSNGQLGDGTTIDRTTPVQVAAGVVAISAGYQHSLLLKTGGTLWAMGLNVNGQLGDGTTTQQLLPVQVATGVTNASAGYAHSAFVKTDGTLWTVGSNNRGQLGDGTTTERHIPVQIASGVAAVAASGSSRAHTLLLKSDGTLWGTGSNFQGELGGSVLGQQTTPIQIATDVAAIAAGKSNLEGHSLFMKTDGTLWALGPNGFGELGNLTVAYSSTPIQIASEVAAVSGGGAFTLFVKTDGTLFAVGANSSGQLGDGSIGYRLVPVQVASDIAAVSRGATLTLFTRTDGTLWSMGANNYGELGDGTTTARTTPAQIAADVVLIAAANTNGSGGYSMFTKTDGTLWAMGNNQSGQLGDGTTTNRSTPVQVATDVVSIAVGDAHSLFIKADGTLWGVGRNSAGALGDGTTTNRLIAVQVATGVAAVAARNNCSFFVKTDGTLWAMGSSSTGQLGLGATTSTSTPVQVASDVASIGTGQLHTLFVKTDGTLWAMGNNSNGQLGDGSTTQRNAPVQVASDVITATGGNFQSVFVKTDGTLWGMGLNGSGELGDGTTTSHVTPVLLAQHVLTVAAGGTSTMFIATGDITPPPTITALTASQTVFAENTATFTVTAEGEPTGYQWERSTDSGAMWELVTDDGTYAGATTATLTVNGVNVAMDGWLFRAVVSNDAGSTPTSASPLTVLPIPMAGSVAWARSSNRLLSPQDSPRAVAGGVSAVAVGRRHTLFLRADGTLWSMGQNANGQLGIGTADNDPHSTPLSVASDVAKIAAGAGHSLFLKADGTLWGMGGSYSGQLGTGTTDNQFSPVQLAADVAGVTAGGSHSLFVKTDGTLWAMGYNASGQLGDGSTTQRLTPVQIATDVVSVAAGDLSSYFIKTDGTLWAMGENTLGQLGDGTNINRSSPVMISAGVQLIAAGIHSALFIKTDGTLWATGENTGGRLGDGTTTNRNSPVQVATNVTNVTAGNGHTLFITSDGTLWGMGYTIYGQLGNGPTGGSPQLTPAPVGLSAVSAAAGTDYSMFLLGDGTLLGAGVNNYGQLGDRQELPPSQLLLSDVIFAGAEASNHNLFVQSDGTLWQQHFSSAISQVPGVTNVIRAIAGSFGAIDIYLTSDGTLWQLDTVGTSTFIASDVVSAGAGSGFYVYLKSDGTLWGTSSNPQIQIGDGTMPVQVADHVVSVSNSPFHLLFVRDDHTLWGMGTTWLGLKPGAPFQQFLTAPGQLETDVVAAVANTAQNLYIRTDGTLWTRSTGWSDIAGPAVMVDSDVVAAASSGTGSLYIKDDGILRSRTGTSGVLGDVEEIAAGVSSVAGGTDAWAIYLQSAGFGTAPTITLEPPSSNLPPGYTLIMTVGATGSGPLAYQWSKDGIAISTARAAQFTIPYGTPADAGVYTATVTNSAGSVTTSPATVTIEKLDPVITWDNPADVTFGTALSGAEFNATADEPGTFAYTPAVGAILNVGVHTLRVDFTPDNPVTFNSVFAEVALNVVPMITPDQSGTVTTTAGGETTLSITTEGGTDPTFQWQLLMPTSGPTSTRRPLVDGEWVNISGATGSSYTIPSTQRFSAGNYRVVVTANGVSVVSEPFVVAVDPPPPSNARLLNMSTRGLAQTGDEILIPGFVIAGSVSKRLLIRAVGPTLAHMPYNVPGTLANPRMALKRLDFSVNPPVYVDVGANDDWQDNTNAAALSQAITDLSAFPFEDDREAALLVDLVPGQYTVFADGVTNATGVAIVELYDADATTVDARLINISNRGFVGTGDNVMIPGFVISHEGPKTLLIRVVGPTLALDPYLVPGTMADPQLQLFRKEIDGSDTLLLTQDNWGDNPDAAHTASTAQAVSAFALSAGSADAAFVVTLPPGVYTVVGSAADGSSSGVVLVEVYIVP